VLVSIIFISTFFNLCSSFDNPEDDGSGQFRDSGPGPSGTPSPSNDRRRRTALRQTLIGQPVSVATEEFKHPTYSPYFKAFDSSNNQVRLQCLYQAEEGRKICGTVLIKQKDKYYNLKTHLEVRFDLNYKDKFDKITN